MGCGRSKHRSKNKDDDDSSSDSKSQKRKQSKQNKSSVQESSKENKNATTKKDIPKRKLTSPVMQQGDTTGESPQKQLNIANKPLISPSNGSLSQNSTNILKQKEEMKSSRLTIKDKQASMNSTNSNSKVNRRLLHNSYSIVRVTNSQLDFFRMLDEKIEQGTDYTSADDT